jgi:ankyrin repeat protein
LNELCCQQNFPEKRFRFLVEWDPNALTQTDEDGNLPLHKAALKSSIRVFQLVFEYGIRYFPEKKGLSLIFKKHYHSTMTPFQEACDAYGYEQVMEVVEDTIIRYSTSLDNAPPLNMVEALINAAIDEYVHLDCVYFLMRREPDVLLKLLSSSSSSASLPLESNDDDDIIIGSSNNNRKENINDSSSSSKSDNDDVTILKKRKRK